MSKISVVIVTKDRKKDLIECLGSLLAQTKKIDQLIVIDNNSSDNTKEIVLNFSKNTKLNIKYICEKKRGYPFIYNRGLEEARFRWVAFIDDDCVADINWFKSIKDAIEKNIKVDVVLGYSETYYTDNIFSLLTFFFQDLWKRKFIFGKKISNYEILDNKNIVYNKTFLLNNNLQYDESRTSYNNGAAEDCELGVNIFNVGGKAIFNKKMRVSHKDPIDFKSFLQKHYYATASYNFFKNEDKSAGQYKEKKMKFRSEFLNFISSLRFNYLKKCKIFFLGYLIVLFSFFINFYLKLRFFFNGRDKFIKIFFLTLTSVLFSLLFIEGWLRLIAYPFQNCSEIPQAFETVFDSTLGWKYKSSQVYKKDFGGIYTINAEGYRTEAKENQTDFSKPIILIVGDSFLFGHGLNFDETFSYKLGKKLEDKYEVINFSAQGYGTDQLYLLLQKLLKTYHPQAVITNYISDHDLRNVNVDRRDLYPCLKYPGTKPIFSIVDKGLYQKKKPQRYSQYDRFKTMIIVRRFVQGDLKKKGNIEGHELSQALLSAMEKETEKAGSKFYLISYDVAEDKEMKLEGKVLGISTYSGSNLLEYHILADLLHPNARSNEMVLDLFLDKFGKDF